MSKTWQPVEDGQYTDKYQPHRYIRIRQNGQLLEVYHGRSSMSTHPSDHLRLCELVAQPAAPVAPEPDWADAPEWANFWAVDPDGTACWYESKPFSSPHHWRPTSGRVHWAMMGGSAWRQTLRQRPARTEE